MSQAFVRPLNDSHPKTLAVEAALAASADFMEALLAAVAIMAHADGEMAPSERRKSLALARDSALLSSFSRDEIVEEIAEHEANYGFDPEVAQLLAREKIVRLAGNRRLAHPIVEACRAMVPADGIAHPSEYRALSEIREMLGLDAFARAHKDLVSTGRRPS